MLSLQDNQPADRDSPPLELLLTTHRCGRAAITIMSDTAKFRLMIWLLYFMGVAAHTLMRAYASMASDANSVTTLRRWWEINWRSLRWSVIGDGVALVLWETHPELTGYFFSRMIPVAYGTAGVMGIAVDRVVGSAAFGLKFKSVTVDVAVMAPNGVSHTTDKPLPSE
jgi:hypothetical protein